MQTPEEVANTVFRDVTGYDFPSKLKKSDEIDKTIYFSALAAVIKDRELIAKMLQDGADEWEASGDDEKFVNEVVDPFILSVVGQ